MLVELPHVVIYTFILFLPTAFPLRCYTDIPATKSLSVECGMNTGCLKIFKKAAQFDEDNTFIPPHRRGEDTQLFRGCFLVAVPDSCYDSIHDGLSYCWCSHTDLCNNSSINFISTSVSWYCFFMTCIVFWMSASNLCDTIVKCRIKPESW